MDLHKAYLFWKIDLYKCSGPKNVPKIHKFLSDVRKKSLCVGFILLTYKMVFKGFFIDSSFWPRYEEISFASC